MFSSSDSDDDWVPEAIANNRNARRYRPRTNFDLYPQQNRARFRLYDGHVQIVLTRLADIIAHDSDRNFALLPEQQVRLSLRYLATGDNFTTVGDSFGVHKSTVSRTLDRFLNAVRATMVDEMIKFPGADAMGYVVEKFRDIQGMPCVIGCIDGSHVEIKTPIKNEGQFVNRHGTHSINMMCVCGPSLRFYYVSAKNPGCVNDSRIFRTSSLCDRLSRNWRPWPNGTLLGDSGYANSDFLVTPILNPRTQQEGRYNKAHRKTRRLIECAFGVLKQRFRCLLRPMHLEPEKAELVILACAALHNLLITDDEVEAAIHGGYLENNDEGMNYHAGDRNLEREDDDQPEGNINRRAALVRLF